MLGTPNLLRSEQNLTSRRIGFVAIGKNEGERLKNCLRSLPATAPIVYVDSGSTDGSLEWAENNHIDVVRLNAEVPFTAARARNAGFARLMQSQPDLQYVQFLDGDCELDPKWPDLARSFLETHGRFCAVFGRRRERFPERTFYNQLCDLEWNAPPLGDSRSFGGDVLIRTDALQGVGGYRNDLIAGEEPELCVRLRAAGWKIWRLDADMTKHDAAILHFYQWWRRTVRSGYAFAQGANLHGARPECHWVWESRRAVAWGILLPLACIAGSLLLSPWGNLLWLAYPVQLTRRMLQIGGPSRTNLLRALFELLARFAEAVGQVKFFVDRVARRQSTIIEYKQT